VTAEALAFAAAAGAALAAGELAAARGTGAARPALASLARLGRRLPLRGGAPAALERRLVEAGRPGGMTARDLLAAKLGAAAAAGAGGLVSGSALPGWLGLVAAALAPVAGFYSPDLWVDRRRRERFDRARRDLPALLDLLRVCVAAGSSLPQALEEVGRRSRAPLARLWAGVAAQVALGVPLASALAAHRRELPIPEIESFVAALARAARHGAPLEETLAAQAREARRARQRAVQERAARAGPKMQLVVALLLVPSVMLIVAAALLSALGHGAAGEMLGGF
jgi:tight adherence protein C